MILAAIIPVGSELVMLYAGALAGGAFAGTSLHVFGTTVHSHPWGFVWVVLALFGSAVFCVGLGGAGWALGSAYTHAHRDIRYVEYAVVAGVVLFAAYLGFRFFKAGRVNRRRADDPAR